MPDPMSYSVATPRIGMPMLFSGQSQKETTVNESLLLMDMLLGGGVHGVRSVPPATPVTGEVWIVGSLPVGAFAGKADALAGWTESGWRFVHPAPGLTMHDLETGGTRIFTTEWKFAETPAIPSGGALVDSEARTTIAAIIDALRTVGIFSEPS